MRMKRFEAPDMRTAMAMVRKELGEDAVIISSKTIPARGTGLAKRYAKPSVEIIAARDADIAALSTPASSSSVQRSRFMPAMEPEEESPFFEPSRIRLSGVAPQASPPPAPTPPPISSVPTTTQALSRSDVAGEVRIEAEELHRRFTRAFRRQGDENVPATPRPAPVRGVSLPIETAEKPKPDDVARWRDQLIDRIQYKSLELGGRRRGPVTIALVGATGVGKTTTAAKIAAWYSLREGRRIALVTMDCYRIGATDQLRTYARIMRLDCDVVLKRQEMRRTLDRHQDKDLIIIDTAGKSPYDKRHVEELGEWFSEDSSIEPYLTVSATTKKEDLAHVFAVYDPLLISGLFLTKLDETRAYATLCQQLVATNLPVACLCTGQRVPEDFLPATPEFLGTLFRKGWDAVASGLIPISGTSCWT